MSGPFGGEDIPEAVPALTPSQVTLARVLDAWEEWLRAPSDLSDEAFAMGEIGDIDANMPMFIGRDGVLTERGADLRDRARKAGVL